MITPHHPSSVFVHPPQHYTLQWHRPGGQILLAVHPNGKAPGGLPISELSSAAPAAHLAVPRRGTRSCLAPKCAAHGMSVQAHLGKDSPSRLPLGIAQLNARTYRHLHAHNLKVRNKGCAFGSPWPSGMRSLHWHWITALHPTACQQWARVNAAPQGQANKWVNVWACWKYAARLAALAVKLSKWAVGETFSLGKLGVSRRCPITSNLCGFPLCRPPDRV